ncbi:glycoside hydrolase family 108 protein [Roseomonas sp. SSH11]|uniref:Glycoside hydrolase family 108 protein n=1 Tax=Pararoseomonas baculiformis TaxID=2820812 RepID=A0ABS4A820_9PROT|nr:glycoside hydrolase family 108 protein [Pararoseomonas baculiformis]MBP0443160.1 glycoside hydrolase family 108 protein [Pararoseomonas baculiformis]
MGLPILALAASLAPEIMRLIAGDRAGAVAGTVAEAVRQATGTEDPATARAALAADPAKAEALRIRLAEIALEGERLLADREAGQRQAELERLRAVLSDTQAARASMVEMLRGGSRLAWGPATVSTLVVLGFFAVLVLLVTLDPGPGGGARFDPQVASIINITVGSLGAAFAAVVNFWIGSSQSSRDKDAIVGRLQEAQARTQLQQAQVAMASSRAVPVRAEAAIRPVSLGAGAASAGEARLEACLEWVLRAEGGFVNHPADPGGATNMGITRRTLAEFREADVTVDDVRALTRAEAREIYRALYWNPMRCAELPAGIDLMVFDFGVNAGPRRSLRMLQRCLGVAADGAVGPITLAAAGACRAPELIARLAEERLAYYRGLSSFGQFGRGWTRRVDDARQAALAMAAGPSTLPVVA